MDGWDRRQACLQRPLPDYRFPSHTHAGVYLTTKNKKLIPFEVYERKSLQMTKSRR